MDNVSQIDQISGCVNSWESRGLYRRFFGDVDGDQIIKSNFELHAHVRFKEIEYIINDFSQITGLLVDKADTKAFAVSDEIISKTKGRLKIAIVVLLEPYRTLAETYCQHMNGSHFECAVFPSREDAQAWAV